ncbi:ZIP family metal transporter [Halorientalis marina]|uniref:ZIP family metal transporter n=1 Tax=Halorientalis marina TaxID=2931976 RepID=UPI001FF0FAF1|nr:ZIP family metal transporter [Halorientalis marina]
MGNTKTPSGPGHDWAFGRRLAHGIGVAALVAFVAVVALGYAAGRGKLTGIVTFGFVAMVAGAAVHQSARFATPTRRLWAAGLASGAMLASAAAFLAPKAIGNHATLGGFAIAFGYLLGYAGHELGHLVGHRSLPLNDTVAELTLHAVLAGGVMGVVYGTLPALTPLFGYGIVAHKLPAGLGGAVALDRDGLPATVMALPAAAVGFAAIPLSLATPALSSVARAVVFGLSTGVFAHVALDMFPECAGGGSGHGHGDVTCGPDADRRRHHAVGSTFGGAAAVALLWGAVTLA